MAAESGLRELKKQRTRQAIFDVARRLFTERGFDAVTVAEIARAAEVSEVTVFNYFPTKEDLFYGGMQFFEEELLQAVAERAGGESVLTALRRRLLESAAGLRDEGRIEAIIATGALVGASSSLQAREREIVERYTVRLADVLGGGVEALVVAGALMAAHRAVVAAVRERVLAGVRGDALVAETRALVRKAYRRLESGLGDYGGKR